MQEDLQPVLLPPGLFRNGTKYQSQGRWYDAHLVRFQGPRIQPIGGWAFAQSSAGGDMQAISGTPRGAVAWAANDGSVKVGVGTTKKLYILNNGTIYDITPAGLVTGDMDSAYAGGGGAYGSGPYGSGAYGVGSLVASLLDADTWQLDVFGDYLVGCLTGDGKIYVWQGVLATPAAQAAGSPTACVGLVVTPERFLFALGAGGNMRKIQWPSQETFATWTPSSTETAGDFEISTNGRLRCGARTKNETLLWTDADCWVANWIGGTLVYSFRQVGDGCGIIAPNAKVVVDTNAYWMGRGAFFQYNGVVNPIPCDLQDYVFTDLNETQSAKIFAMRFAEFGEVWWFYPSGSSTEVDRYVAYNYREKHWSRGSIVRVAGFDQGAAPNPIMLAAAYAAQGTLTSTGVNVSNGNQVTIGSKTYTFQTVLTNVDGNVFIGATAAISLSNLFAALNLGAGSGTAYAALTSANATVQGETLSATTILVRARVSGSGGNSIVTTETAATLSWGGGTLAGGGSMTLGYPVGDVYEHEIGSDRGTEVPYLESGPYELDGGNHVVRIQNLVPDEKNLGDVRAYLYTSMYPNETEVLHGPYSMTNPTNVRISAKIIRLKLEQFVETAWRVGILRFTGKAEGRR